MRLTPTGLQSAGLLDPALRLRSALLRRSSRAGSASIDLAVTATSSGGTAFFDSGVGYLCRLAAIIPGVTVNSVTRTERDHRDSQRVDRRCTPGPEDDHDCQSRRARAGSSGSILRVTPGALVTLESPVAGGAGSPLEVCGWAVDGAATSGTGMDAVHVWAYPAAGNPVFLGVATYGSPART